MVPITPMKKRCGWSLSWHWVAVTAIAASTAGGIAGCSNSSTAGTSATGGSTAGSGGAGRGGTTGGTGGTGLGSGGTGLGSGGSGPGSGGSGLGSGGSGGGAAAADAAADATSDGPAVQSLATFNADGDLGGFLINPYSDVNNLGDATRDGGALATLSWDGTEGTPDKGALKLTASYSDFGQFVIVQHDFSDLDLRDWTGRRLHISLKIAGGFTPGGAVKVFVQDQVAGTDGGAATYPYADQYQTVASGTDWQEFTFDLDHATYRNLDWNASSIQQVRWFGVNVDAGMAPLDDAGVVIAGKPTPATIYIDNVWLE